MQIASRRPERLKIAMNFEDKTISRVLGHYKGQSLGPTVVLIGGVHGNEPAGVQAINSVFQKLPQTLCGEVWGVAGNLQALAQNRRYLKRDLNRHWTPDELEPLCRSDPEKLDSEVKEQWELLHLFRHIVQASSTSTVVFVDLHTMSGPGAPFICMADVLRNRRVAFALPIPVVLGLEEVIEGSMLGYLCDLGHVGIAVEGGQHEDPVAVGLLETVAWIALHAVGALSAEQIPGLDERRRELAQTALGLPDVLEIRHRHVCSPDDGFEMLPGFSSFQSINRGQLLAKDSLAEHRAHMSGVMLLPRYQGAGADGFFLARPVHKFWLVVSTYLRRVGLNRWLGYLPGVQLHPDLSETFLVNPKVARFWVTEIFHLLGYRRVRAQQGWLAFSRRRPDDEPTAELPAVVERGAQMAGVL
ncbi:MAG: succinylglutamate desuccinylase/aspartoacylase family protein [Myxococcales bacterium]|nr:succinylglutamate desuccinylase/aspartoacylase family protein [Myxococcales bacterium]